MVITPAGIRLLATLEGFQLVESAGPVGAEEAGEAAVGQELAAGLAAGAVVGLVVGVTDALDFFAAARARLAITAVNRHAFSEGGDLLGKTRGGFGAETIDPELKGAASRVEEAFEFAGF